MSSVHVSISTSVYVFYKRDSVSVHTYVFCLGLCFCTSSSKYVDVSSVPITVMCSVFVSVHISIYNSACVFLFIGTVELSVHVIVPYLHRIFCIFVSISVRVFLYTFPEREPVYVLKYKYAIIWVWGL